MLMRQLNRTYGLPENTIQGSKDTYPTIPSSHINVCTVGNKYFSELPLDKQANLVALAFMMVKSYQTHNHRNYAQLINNGDTHYGDSNFRNLNSFRTM